MITLVFTACTILLSGEQQCKDVPLSFADVSMFQCLMGAQTEIARWTAEHDGWFVPKGYRCEPPNRFAKT